MSSFHNRRDLVIVALDVLLRVPPLFVMDGILTVASDAFVFKYLDLPHEGLFWLSVWCVILSLSFVAAVAAVTLGTIYLITLYNHILFFTIIMLSRWRNWTYLTSELSSNYADDSLYHLFVTKASKLTGNVVIQASCAIACNTLRDSRLPRMEKYTQIVKPCLDCLTFLSFLLPTILRLMILPEEYLKLTPAVSLLMPLGELMISTLVYLPAVWSFINRMYNIARYMVKTFGLATFLEAQWKRMHVSEVLKSFWGIFMSVYAIYYTLDLLKQQQNCEHECRSFGDAILEILSKLLIRSSETVIALLGLTSAVAFLMHHLGVALAFFLGSTNEDDKSMGTVSAVLFFILSLQTGLTGLQPSKRLTRLYKNFCLLSTAILHFTHGMVNPILEQLSAMGYQSPRKHARVLLMCACLIILPTCFISLLWSQHETSTWLLAVTAFSVEVMVKVCVSLIVYVLFMVDTHSEGYWDKLDDYIYYVKGTGACIEFVFGIFLFCNGGYIMLFESGGMIRAVMMCIHAYFNIWVQAKEGWQKFMRRRTAVDKINLLPELSSSQLAERGMESELCAICFQELTIARMTRCQHYFHSNCLRKWLYQQDKCPLCHQAVSLPEDKDGEETTSNHVNENNANMVVENNVHLHQD